jgi:serine/threonine protein kinase
VKVLDFGVAKALDLTDAAEPTDAGIIVGTAAYMSPEQARGGRADKASDVWAFGAVLYEMLSGKRAFRGDAVSDTLAGVLREEVDWAQPVWRADGKELFYLGTDGTITVVPVNATDEFEEGAPQRLFPTGADARLRRTDSSLQCLCSDEGRKALPGREATAGWCGTADGYR